MIDADAFADHLEDEARECELQATFHEERAHDPEHREAGNLSLVAAQVLRRIARAAREAEREAA